MNRGLVYSLCAALAVISGAAHAATDLSLNLRYNDPADPSDGGTWTLVAKSDSATTLGIAAVLADLDNIDSTGISIQSDIGALLAGNPLGDPVVATATGAQVTYGQDLSSSAGNPAPVAGVGTSASPAAAVLATDPLRNAAWDGATMIASGTFSGARPEFLGADGNEFTTFSTTVGATNPVASTTVRGDSLDSLTLENIAGTGLLGGDTDRNGVVNLSDLGTLAFNFDTAGGWDDGDTDGNGTVNLSDLGTLAFNFDQTTNPPAVSGVPEPSSVALILLGGLLGAARIARRTRA